MQIHPKAIDQKAFIYMILICIIWGLETVIIKMAADDMSPILQISIRSGIACLLVGLFVFFKKEFNQLKFSSWRAGSVAGFLFALEYFLAGEGLEYSSASHIIIFLYTAPIFAALGLGLFNPEETLNRTQWVGILISFLGIAVAFVDPDAMNDKAVCQVLWGDFLGLLAGIAWGATTVVIRSTSLNECPPSQVLFYQLLGGFLVLLAASFLLNQTEFHFTVNVLISLSFQTVIIAFASFLLWFWLLRHYLASILGILSFLTPIFGVVFGAVFLKEPLSIKFIVGSVLVTVGIVVVTVHQKLYDLFKRS